MHGVSRLPRVSCRHRVDPPRRAPRRQLRPALPRTEHRRQGVLARRSLLGVHGQRPRQRAFAQDRLPRLSPVARAAGDPSSATNSRRPASAPPATGETRGRRLVLRPPSLALAGGNRRAPSCPDCHSAHRVRPAAATESTVNRRHLGRDLLQRRPRYRPQGGLPRRPRRVRRRRGVDEPGPPWPDGKESSPALVLDPAGRRRWRSALSCARVSAWRGGGDDRGGRPAADESQPAGAARAACARDRRRAGLRAGSRRPFGAGASSAGPGIAIAGFGAIGSWATTCSI